MLMENNSEHAETKIVNIMRKKTKFKLFGSINVKVRR